MDVGPQRLKVRGLKGRIVNFLFLLEGFLADKLYAQFKMEVDLLTNSLNLPREKFFVIHRSPSYPRPPERNWEIKTAEKELYILGVSGWWQDVKNLHGALRVFKEVSEEIDDLEYYIAGKFYEGEYEILDEETLEYTGETETGKEYKEKIERLIEKLGIKDKVNFLGVKTGQELRKIFRKAKIYYVPAKLHGLSRANVEAMASGTPIVSINSSAKEEIIGDGECGFLRDTEEGQRDAILKLLEDEEIYEEMQRNCLKKARGHAWGNLGGEWKKVLEDVAH